MIPIPSAVFSEADLSIKICKLTTAIRNTDYLRQNKIDFSSNTNLVGEVDSKSPSYLSDR